METMRTAEMRVEHATYMRRWRRTHPMSAEQRRKDISRSYAGVYKRRGLLQPNSCADCNAEHVEMHHEDYVRPLDVIWLCRRCHMARHAA